ncbi:MAG: hypothetical protein JWM76_730 [Pseudonocardiales bacterium]|nr:hypothetical protein [Pseudonocardiales bacterium]
MLNRSNKIGLMVAFLLGLSDIAILGALSDDDGPPIAIVAISVTLGVLTLGLIARVWRSGPTWALMIGILVLRLVSGLGDLAALGESAVVVTISMIFLAVTLVDVYLLRNWFKKPAGAFATA